MPYSLSIHDRLDRILEVDDERRSIWLVSPAPLVRRSSPDRAIRGACPCAKPSYLRPLAASAL